MVDGGMVEINLTVIAGDTFQPPAFTLDRDATGYTAFVSAKAVFDDDVADASAVVRIDSSRAFNEGGITISGTSATVIMPEIQTALLTPGTLYRWDLKIKSPSGVITTQARGSLAVIGGVTNRTLPGSGATAPLLAGNNLQDVQSVAQALINLGLTDADGNFYLGADVRFLDPANGLTIQKRIAGVWTTEWTA